MLPLAGHVIEAKLNKDKPRVTGLLAADMIVLPFAMNGGLS
jgi:hypothetical protein